MAGEAFHQALALLKPLVPSKVGASTLNQFQTHLALVRQWNPIVSVVSEGDVAFLEERHLIDSLSLVPYVLQYCGPSGSLLDIGSGGGFPVLPVKCVLPELKVVLIERSARKAGFLQRVVAALQLDGVQVIHGNFPEALPKVEANCVTARAVERPRQLLPTLLKRMPLGCAFLCQSDVVPVPGVKTFHVEHIDDAWRQAALRRGELYIITQHSRP